MKRMPFVLAFVVMIMSTISVGAQNEGVKEAAISSVQGWLKLLDDGEYDQCWENASEFFKAAVDKTSSAQYLAAARRPLGGLVSREVFNAEYQESLPGAPDGQYVVIVFKTEFQNKKLSYETVTPKLEADGTWRVSGYYIR